VRGLRLAFVLSLCLAAFAAAPTVAKPRDPAHAITSELICPCSCGEVLSGCTCETGKSMQATVENGIKQGKNKDQIVGALVSQYGEVIRGAPKAEGFNLIVWIAPFAATLAGFALAFWILTRWVKRRGPLAAAGAGPGEAAGRDAPARETAFPAGRSLEADLESLRARAEAELRQIRK
jgi:cytochrome c-type biogenesis protein CcmH/NrfF